MDPASENIVALLIQLMKDWFGRPYVDELSIFWKAFIHILRKKGEEIGAFLLKFETAEVNLKCSNVQLSPLTIAIHLLEAINVDENQRRNIISNIKFDDNPDVYTDLKKAIKLLEGTLVKKPEENKETVSSDDTFYGDQNYTKTFHKRNENPNKREYSRQ